MDSVLPSKPDPFQPFINLCFQQDTCSVHKLIQCSSLTNNNVQKGSTFLQTHYQLVVQFHEQYDDYMSIKLPLTWREIPWLFPDLEEIFFPEHFLPCGNHVWHLRCFLEKFLSQEFWSVQQCTCRFAFQITVCFVCLKNKGRKSKIILRGKVT